MKQIKCRCLYKELRLRMVTPGNVSWKRMVGGQINTWVEQETNCEWRSTAISVLMQEQSEATRSWLADDLKACADQSFDWPITMEGDKVHLCSSRCGKSIARKIPMRGTQGSIELNINSGLCFSKNRNLFLSTFQMYFK